jgi:hypothetical protein
MKFLELKQPELHFSAVVKSNRIKGVTKFLSWNISSCEALLGNSDLMVSSADICAPDTLNPDGPVYQNKHNNY